MQTKFKRHQKVRLLRAPNLEDVEPYFDHPEKEVKEINIEVGMIGEINIILPNGQYHVKILDKKGETIAYAAFDEESLEAVDD